MGCLCSSKNEIPNKGLMRSATFSTTHDPLEIPFDNFSTFRNFHSEYKLLKDPIGSGLFGEIRLCHQFSTNKLFAVKVISKAGLPSDHIHKKQIESQVKLMQSIDHPSILKIFDYFEDACHFYLVMEYIKGGDLLAKLERTGKFPEKEAAKVMKQLFSALAYMHAHDIVHRDVKCDNILLEENQGLIIARLIDFDTIAKLGENKKLKGAYGTVYYMAPELIEGLYDEKCDVWSAGVVLYAMITKTFPFGGACDEVIMRNILQTKINFEALKIWRASDELIDFLQQVLNTCPKKRVSAKDACSHPWIDKHCKISLRPSPLLVEGLKFSNFLSQALKMWAVKNIIPAQEIAEYHMMFINSDKDIDGVINEEELERVVGDRVMAERLMRLADWNSNGVLEYYEFLSVVIGSEVIQKYSQEIIRVLDKDSSGKVSLNSLVSFLEYSLEGQMENRTEDQNDEISDSDILALILTSS